MVTAKAAPEPAPVRYPDRWPGIPQGRVLPLLLPTSLQRRPLPTRVQVSTPRLGVNSSMNYICASSCRRQDVNDAAREQLLGLRAVRGHVWRGSMGLERVHALPLLDHQERIRAPVLLDRQRRIGVDRGAIFDAALLGAHRRNVGAERSEHFLALARLCGDDGDDMDHGSAPESRTTSSGGRPASQKMIAFCSKSAPSASAFWR